jgi:hypothetical protein
MDNEINQLEEWTMAVLSRLETIQYEEMAELVEERQRLIEQLQLGSTTQEQMKQYQVRISSLLQQDESILRRMSELKTEATDGIKKINAGRVQKGGYDTNYNLDGILFDKKK